MLPPDPMFPPQPYWSRSRVFALFLGLWYVLIASIFFHPVIAMRIAVFSCVWCYFLWSPFEFNLSLRLHEPPKYPSPRDSTLLVTIVNVLLWIVYLLPALYYIYYAIAIGVSDPEVPVIHRFKSAPM
jgi:hypothetical protein